MTKIGLTGISEKERELLEQAAEEADMSLAKYCRTRLRAGHRLWTAGGQFDLLEMQQRLENHDNPRRQISPTPETSSSEAERDRFKQSIKRAVPTDGSIGKDELTEIVNSDVVGKALRELMDAGEVEYDPMSEEYSRPDGGSQ